MKRFSTTLVLAALLCALSPIPARAGFFSLTEYHPYGPLSNRSQNPLYLMFLFEPLERPQTLKKKEFSTSIETSFSNLFENHLQATGISVDMDMELIRTAVNVNYGVTDSYEIGLQIPFMSFSGGFMDSFIQDFHHAFGFPNAGRERVPNGRFSYQISDNGNTIYNVNQKNFGVSDIIIRQKLKLLDEQKIMPAIGLKAAFKVPTGSVSQGTGSGSPDFSFSILAEKSYRRFHSYSQLGFSALGSHSFLNDILTQGALIFGQAFEFNLTEHCSLVAQLWGNSPIFQGTGIHELENAVVDLTLGVTGAFPLKKNANSNKRIPTLRYQTGFTEDLTSKGPSVDFTLYFNLGLTY